ncbi:Hypothetical predicted protein [Mytilus galloprovincialis]|uniref:Prolow-density lipoprotein receptor-related protein 1-like beta-propeller domain-containing protein n=1 Tax=Mytilus galloprovincialis TaxID=29158 RepID=A0A8B6BU87_MYTGA|nr:Hypothetical predicted protein [Mytilus galloprovincialis]
MVSTVTPLGIAFDSVNRNLYWSESQADKIKRCNPDGTNVTFRLTENRPSAIKLDIHNRWIYYAQDTSPSKIFRTNLDGMDKRVIINNVAANVYGIGVDVDVESIYWMECQTGDLQSATFNGTDVKRIISTNATYQNVNIEIDGDFIFYTSNNKIMKINKSSGQNPTVVHTDTEQILAVLFYKQEGKSCVEN